MKPFARFTRDFTGKKILIFGLGLLGRGADVARIFCQIGCKVSVTDARSEDRLRLSLAKLKGLPIHFTLGEHRKDDISSTDIIIRNPAVPWNHPLLESARQQQIPIFMDTALFIRYFPGQTVGITGTRGKTTTTMLIYNLLKAGQTGKVSLAGNTIKHANLRLLKQAKTTDIVVMELSSWELQGFQTERKSPHIAVVTNLYEDHLNTYRNMQEYACDKEIIFLFQNQSDYVLLNRDNFWTRSMAHKTGSQVVWFTGKDFPSQWELRLRGEHNFENAAAALKVSDLFAIKRTVAKQVFARFPGVPHRLETIASWNGIDFINDTTATTPIATIKALETINPPIILLVGGNSKSLPLGTLPDEIVKRVKAAVILQGTGSENLRTKLSHINKDAWLITNKKFDAAVAAALDIASSGDTILLSPAFTSYAEFNNEFERGERFTQLVKRLIKKKERK